MKILSIWAKEKVLIVIISISSLLKRIVIMSSIKETSIKILIFQIQIPKNSWAKSDYKIEEICLAINFKKERKAYSLLNQN